MENLYDKASEILNQVKQAVVAHEIWDGDSYTKEQIDKIINESVEIVNRDFK